MNVKKMFGFLAVAGLLFVAAPTQQASAASLAGPGIAAAVQGTAGEKLTTRCSIAAITIAASGRITECVVTMVGSVRTCAVTTAIITVGLITAVIGVIDRHAS